MCEYCEKEKIMLNKNVISHISWGWGSPDIKINRCENCGNQEADDYELGVFIDRGYLRLVDLDDCGCMDHGQRIKLNFCPFCGNNLLKE